MMDAEIERFRQALERVKRESEEVITLREQVAELQRWREEAPAYFMSACRGVEPGDECPACRGWGRRSYASTATWRGGCGGQTITTDVCDKCWGSGSRAVSWADLRRMTGHIQALETQRDAALASAREEIAGLVRERDASLAREKELREALEVAERWMTEKGCNEYSILHNARTALSLGASAPREPPTFTDPVMACASAGSETPEQRYDRLLGEADDAWNAMSAEQQRSARARLGTPAASAGAGEESKS